MLKRLCSAILLTFLILSIFAFYIQSARASRTIYILADGNIDPPTAPIQRVGNTYTFTANIYDSIVIEKSGIIVDGNGYTLQGTGSELGIYLNTTTSPITGVTLRNMQIRNFLYAIFLTNASNYNTITGNTITNNYYGIGIGSSCYNTISGNTITSNTEVGIYLYYKANYTNITGNTITNNKQGIVLTTSYYNTINGNIITSHTDIGVHLKIVSNNNNIICNAITNNNVGVRFFSSCKYNTISENTIKAHSDSGILSYNSSSNIINRNVIMENTNYGIAFGSSSNNNTIKENIITNNNYGIKFWSGSKYNTVNRNTILTNSLYGVYLDIPSKPNTFYHNDFIDNGIHALGTDSANIWNKEHPTGGNYWSGYTGVDVKSGPNQTLPGSDGIGDTAYIIDAQNKDNYPLMTPVRIHDIAVTDVTMSKTVIGQGYPVTITVTLRNKSTETKTFNMQVTANTTKIKTAQFSLQNGETKTVTIMWSTTGYTKGAYRIHATVDRIPGETNSQAEDNVFRYGIIKITVPGDTDGDRDIDIFDIVKLTSSYGAKRGDPRYFPNADIDSNGEISIFDVVIATSRYGYKE